MAIPENVCQRKRLDYLDFCKVLAIFLVTVAHCAQQISGQKFPDMMLSKDSFISVNMAIFMLASGYVMNLDKMRHTSIKEFFISKAIRLLFPMSTWYLVMCVVTFHMPCFAVFWSLYWYLGALFVCLLTIKILADFVPNTMSVCLLSILVLTCIPMISFERSCYMIPFLWTGYVLRLYINSFNKSFTLLFFLIFICMYYFWDIRYSIYMSPFHIWNVDYNSVYAMLYRFFIGVIGGYVIIITSKVLIEFKGFGWMRKLANLGPYTLVFYTMSFVLNAILVSVLRHINFFVTTLGLLDLISVLLAMIMMGIMFFFQKSARKNRWLCLFFLGER